MSAGAAAWALAAAALLAAAPAARALEIVQAEFGLFGTPGRTQDGFRAGAVVPHVVDQGYGWIIRLAGAPARVRVREEVTAPAPPQTWGDPEPGLKRRVSADGRSVLTELTLDAPRGVIAQGWAVAPGDPKGSWTVKVTVEGLPPQVFRFELR